MTNEKSKELNENELDEEQLEDVAGGLCYANDMTPEEAKRDFWFKGGVEENC